jgi:signal transduction histidine kinase
VALPNLLRTSAFRLTLVYMALFTVSMLFVLGFVYWTTVRYLDEQIDKSIESEADELRTQYQESGLEGLREIVTQRGEVFDDEERVYLLAAPDYAMLAGNLSVWPVALRQRSGWLDLKFSEGGEEDEDWHEGAARALAVALPGGYRLLVGRDLHEREDLREHTLQALTVMIGLSLLLALTSGLVVSRAILRRIETISRTGRSIMAGDLSQRVPLTGRGDEFDQLAINLNAMLDRIQRLMEGMRQVTDNVAHDLRSPLTRLRSRLEVTLLMQRSNNDYRTAIEQTLSDVGSLLGNFNALLSIAQVESGADRGGWQSVDLSALVRDIVELYQPLAEDKGVQFTQQIRQDLRLRGNRSLLTQAIGNLLDNAIKYTPRGGTIQLNARHRHEVIEVVVSDNGLGIPADMREKVLERFVRLGTNRTTPGNGLGLSLVRAVAWLHNTKLELADAHPGLSVSLQFPFDLICSTEY